MTLAAGKRVYLDLGPGGMSDVPLRGVVDQVNKPPYVVRVVGENFAPLTFDSTDQTVNRLVVYGDDATSIDGKVFKVGELIGTVIRSWMREPETANERTVLFLVVRADPRGRQVEQVPSRFYYIAPYASGSLL